METLKALFLIWIVGEMIFINIIMFFDLYFNIDLIELCWRWPVSKVLPEEPSVHDVGVTQCLERPELYSQYQYQYDGIPIPKEKPKMLDLKLPEDNQPYIYYYIHYTQKHDEDQGTVWAEHTNMITTKEVYEAKLEIVRNRAKTGIVRNIKVQSVLHVVLFEEAIPVELDTKETENE